MLKLVIITRFTMSRFETDEAGRLYDPRTRSFLKEMPPAHRPRLEALAAFGLTGKLMHLHMERWTDLHDLSEGRLKVLGNLRMRGPMPMAAIAEALNTTPRNVTGLVDHLERDGLVERVPDPADRRSVLARLTEGGGAKVDSLWKAGLTRQVELTKDFSEEELAQLRDYCLRLAQRMEELGRSE